MRSTVTKASVDLSRGSLLTMDTTTIARTAVFPDGHLATFQTRNRDQIGANKRLTGTIALVDVRRGNLVTITTMKHGLQCADGRLILFSMTNEIPW